MYSSRIQKKKKLLFNDIWACQFTRSLFYKEKNTTHRSYLDHEHYEALHSAPLIRDMYEQFSFNFRKEWRDVSFCFLPPSCCTGKSEGVRCCCCLLGSEAYSSAREIASFGAKQILGIYACMDANDEALPTISSKGIDENKAMWSSVSIYLHQHPRTA